MEAGDEEAAMLYTSIYEWAKSLGATKIFVQKFSDVPRLKISATVGQVRFEQVPFVPVAVKE
jgi:hypothetical protein